MSKLLYSWLFIDPSEHRTTEKQKQNKQTNTLKYFLHVYINRNLMELYILLLIH